MAATAAETKALAALKTAENKFRELKAASYNAQVNAAYDKLATQMQTALDALEAEAAEEAEVTE